uniref:Large ribosomal subunit protein uL4c n=1 Tax=Nitzschia alba TaxID=2858 RepID=A0A5C0F2S2_NITAL|nr:50S ribosomal protein L4 [Nitzschia alba]QEI59612.1 50S ribosomal protein L4 [Nitzschia alba]
MIIQKNIKYDILYSARNFSTKFQELNFIFPQESGNFLLFKDYLRHLNSQYKRTASTKNRSKVQGGGHKPWRQKGTGRARSGSNRSPLWKGGGVIFGPKPKKTLIKLNKKERKLALQTILYNKQKNVLIIDNIENNIINSKTKTFLNICLKYNINLNKKTLFIISKKIIQLKRSTNNIPYIKLISVFNLNTFNLLNVEQTVITLSALHILKSLYYE